MKAIIICVEPSLCFLLAQHLFSNVFCSRYICQPTASISEALQYYDAAFEGSRPEGRYAASPLPPYASQTDQGTGYDMCYHLLKLYSDKSHPLHKLLAPNTSTPNPLDYSLRYL